MARGAGGRPGLGLQRGGGRGAAGRGAGARPPPLARCDPCHTPTRHRPPAPRPSPRAPPPRPPPPAKVAEPLDKGLSEDIEGGAVALDWPLRRISEFLETKWVAITRWHYSLALLACLCCTVITYLLMLHCHYSLAYAARCVVATVSNHTL